ncbi:MAG: DUF2894 domain-containing protein [Ketobacter sp.]|nr:MAG: DUF2894 domain-containing protein [Ketobacter sp.]
MSDVADGSKTQQDDAKALDLKQQHVLQCNQLQQQWELLNQSSINCRQSVQLHRVAALLRRAADSRTGLGQRLLEKARDSLQAIQSQPLSHQHAIPVASERESLIAGLIRQLEQRTQVSDADQEPTTFEALLRRQEVEALRQVDDEDAVASLDAIAPVGELKALQQFREDWARRSTEKAVIKAMEEAPEDAGPLNAHRLVVKALETMQDVSPEYLGRFVNYIESLLWLEQAAARSLVTRKEEKGKRRR